MDLIRPGTEHLDAYVDALRRGWSPDTQRPEAALDALAEIDADPVGFLERVEDRDPQGRTVTLPDGSVAPRLPGFSRWMWDDGFCGAINLRWQPGTVELPPHCLGHIGYSVVPWRRRRGYATEALRQMLDLARAEGLRAVDITTDLDNVASRRVIEANGGADPVVVGKPASSSVRVSADAAMAPAAGHGPGEALRFRIELG